MLSGMLLLMAASIGQETKVPLVAIRDKMVEVGVPIQLVATGDVQAFDWLEKGRYLVYLCDPAPNTEAMVQSREDRTLYHYKRENALYLYDTTTGRTLPLQIGNIDFWAVALNGRAVIYTVYHALVRAEESEQPFERRPVQANTTLYLRMPNQSQPTVLAQIEGRFDPYRLFSPVLSPDGRYLFIRSAKPQLLDLQTRRVVNTFERTPFSAVWSSNTELHLAFYQNRRQEYALYDVRTNRLMPSTQEVFEQASKQASERSSLRRMSTYLQLEAHDQPDSRWMPAARLILISRTASTQRFIRAVVAHDADPNLYALAPDESGVAYRSWRGQLFYLPLTKRDPQTLPEKLACGQQKLTDEEIRQHYGSNAKQIGKAILMYCQDYDETFPPSLDVVQRLQPYLKFDEAFRDLFSGEIIFTYLLDGQSLSEIPAPADTPIGRLDWGDPKVIAVIYADGHVKFKPRN